MATQISRQELANQLNTLQQNGATEDQISAAVSAAGYKDSDFNISLSGTYEPLVVRGSTGTGNSSSVNTTGTFSNPADTAWNDAQLAASQNQSTPTAKSVTRSTNTTVVAQQTTDFNQSTGGGSSTVYSKPATDTPQSTAYQQQGDQQTKLAQAYGANPNSKIGQATLQRSLNDGTITQDQYDQLKNATPEEREANKAKSAQLYSGAADSYDQSANAKQPSGVAIVVDPSQNSSSSTVSGSVTKTTTSTYLNGNIPESGVKTTQVEGVNYQVTKNADGSETYTPANSPSVNSADATSVTVPTETVTSQQSTIDANTQGLPVVAEDGSLATSKRNPETGELYTPVSTVTPPVSEPQKEIPAKVQVFDDGTKLETFSDGATLSTDTEGNQEFRSSVAAAPGGDIGTTANPNRPVTAATLLAKASPSKQDVVNYNKAPDWRFRIGLAPKSNYLFNVSDAGVLEPLKKTNGVLFPYTPQVTVSYTANYDATDLTHNNYKFYTYRNSAVEQVTINADFTAQDTTEASYVLAVIHFFRSVTKMFYGQDQNPIRGTPPPLVYLSGFGAYHFDNHPGVVTNFGFTYPNDVDYISTGLISAGVNTQAITPDIPPAVAGITKLFRLFSSNLQPGAVAKPPAFQNATQSVNKRLDDSRIPTKLTMSITVLPIVTRYDVSNNFSVKDYANGSLMLGSKRNGGGIW